MTKLFVVGTAVQSENTKKIIEKKFEVKYLTAAEFSGDLSTNAYENSIIWIHFDSKINENYARALENVLWIATTTTSITHITLNMKLQLGTRLISLADFRDKIEGINSTAEHAWSLVMHSHQNVSTIDADVKKGNWERNAFLREKQLKNLTLGIIGFGRLGKKVAQYANAFEMNVLVSEISQEVTTNTSKNPNIEFVTLPELLKKSDIVTLHASTQNISAPILDERILNEIERPIKLINTARGILVDENAIVSAIQKGRISHYLADVLQIEDSTITMNKSNLLEFHKISDKVTLTPHIGGASKDAMEYAEAIILEELIRRDERAHA
jgi:D-3-phosphoglycerate dehydrogenase / 2-oxoglutarate reductase